MAPWPSVWLHCGEIGAESTPGAGSTFTVRLPLGAVATPPAADSSSAAATARPAAPHPEELALALSIYDPEASRLDSWEEPAEDRTTELVVDDNPDVSAYVRSVPAASFRVIEAGDGRAGLESARAERPRRDARRARRAPRRWRRSWRRWRLCCRPSRRAPPPIAADLPDSEPAAAKPDAREACGAAAGP